jgi:hypothetical protein
MVMKQPSTMDKEPYDMSRAENIKCEQERTSETIDVTQKMLNSWRMYMRAMENGEHSDIDIAEAGGGDDRDKEEIKENQKVGILGEAIAKHYLERQQWVEKVELSYKARTDLIIWFNDNAETDQDKQEIGVKTRTWADQKKSQEEANYDLELLYRKNGGETTPYEMLVVLNETQQKATIEGMGTEKQGDATGFFFFSIISSDINLSKQLPLDHLHPIECLQDPHHTE